MSSVESEIYLANLWRWKCGLPEISEPSKDNLNIDSLYKSEWSEEFEGYMRNRLVMGAMRYGKIGDTKKPTFDRIGSIKKRLELYNDTGNKEYLVDIANLCLLEFVEGKHKNSHFKPIDDGEHVKLKL